MNIKMSKSNDYTYLLKDTDGKKYFILNYQWFKDYYKIINVIFSESVLRYNPSPKTKSFIELTAMGDCIGGIVKIPILVTNITTEFITKIKHTISFSKFNNSIIALIFHEKNISIRYTYNAKIKYIELSNDSYFSLSHENVNDTFEEDIEDDEKIDENEIYEIKSNTIQENINDKISEQNKKLCSNNYMHSYSITEQNYSLEEQRKIYNNINDNVIKNVISYVNIEYENLKDMFKILGNGRINIIIKNNLMTFKGIVPKQSNKQVIFEISVVNLNKNYYDKEISFFINSNSIIKLKSLSNNFNIIATDNKKIFKYVELKIVSDVKNDKYGITLSPGNFTQKNRKNNNTFDIYSSIMLYVSEIS